MSGLYSHYLHSHKLLIVHPSVHSPVNLFVSLSLVLSVYTRMHLSVMTLLTRPTNRNRNRNTDRNAQSFPQHPIPSQPTSASYKYTLKHPFSVTLFHPTTASITLQHLLNPLLYLISLQHPNPLSPIHPYLHNQEPDSDSTFTPIH